MRPCYFTDVHPLAIEKLRREKGERASSDLIDKWMKAYEKIEELRSQRESLEKELHAGEDQRMLSGGVDECNSLLSKRKQLESSIQKNRDEEMLLRQRMEMLDGWIKRSGG